jgi:hypothetical protein
LRTRVFLEQAGQTTGWFRISTVLDKQTNGWLRKRVTGQADNRFVERKECPGTGRQLVDREKGQS